MILPFDRILLLSDDSHIKVQNIPPTVPLVKLDTHHHETEKKNGKETITYQWTENNRKV